MQYDSIYDSYWSRQDRLGESSFDDPRPIAVEILRTCGTGRILDVGSGMGVLVRTLLSMGADAYGIDVSSVATDRCNRFVPGRFHQGSILELPFGDDEFDIVVSTDCMEHLATGDVPLALRELHRVSRRAVYLRLSTEPDRDNRWHLTPQKRDWWENQLFAAGFRKHPRSMVIAPYELLEFDSWQITLVLEKLPAAALQHHSMDSLLAARDLHMDMLRETGRRSDAHVARYQLVARHVRPNDVVLDAACGMGYGSAVLAANTQAARVIGVDLDADAVRYASDTTGATWSCTEFHTSDATALTFLDDASVDFVASFETLEHVPDPVALLKEFTRVLKPTGRVVVSVPNLWVDETGEDPNPHHLHVYDWQRLASELQLCFELEAVWAQTAGGGMNLTDAQRVITPAKLCDPTGTPAEWWLAMAMKTPVGADPDGYHETSYLQPQHVDLPHSIAFGRDYDNPWLVKSVVARGHRALNDDLLSKLCSVTLESSRPTSADTGAALCVLAYRLCGDDAATIEDVDALVTRIESYVRAPASNPNVSRWQISLHYVAAKLHLWCGRREEARAEFERCAELDASQYSPILGTKTVDALFQIGMIDANHGDFDGARAAWIRAIATCEQLFKGDWETWLGAEGQPLVFVLPEATDVIDIAAEAARGLAALPSWDQRAGLSWEIATASKRSTRDVLAREVNAFRKLAEARGASGETKQILSALCSSPVRRMIGSIRSIWPVRFLMRIFRR